VKDQWRIWLEILFLVLLLAVGVLGVLIVLFLQLEVVFSPYMEVPHPMQQPRHLLLGCWYIAHKILCAIF